MTGTQFSWSLAALIALGAFHGLNPAMGWLFAVARGFQERRLRAVFGAFGPITLGHLLAIAFVAVPVGLLGMTIPRDWLLIATGLSLVAFALIRQIARLRHPRWVAMRVRPRELAVWSFLMATSHGAGLMLAPVLAGSAGESTASAEHAHHVGMASSDHAQHLAGANENGLGAALLAISLHTGAMFLAGATIAFVVYRLVGVEGLRRYWINLDLIWAAALILTGSISLGIGAWSLATG